VRPEWHSEAFADLEDDVRAGWGRIIRGALTGPHPGVSRGSGVPQDPRWMPAQAVAVRSSTRASGLPKTTSRRSVPTAARTATAISTGTIVTASAKG
jgi:hypothetical protein